jgi:hypothetical protein
MPDYIGNIEVPQIGVSGTFPIIPDYPYGMSHEFPIAEHQFGSANTKITQRFLLGNGARRFTIYKSQMRESDRIALRNFWENQYGPYGAFTYNAPNDDGNGTTPILCRFANEPLSWEFLSDVISSVGITLIEIPATSPSYVLNQTVLRFPSEALKTALLSQIQKLIPLVKIQPRQPGYPAIHVSDRRATIGSQLYLPRLLEFAGISQGMSGESDQAQFTFGNADRVMRNLVNDVDLIRASLEFSLFHVGTGIKLDLWKGEIVDWSMDTGPEFHITAADGMYELTLPYPTRKISRSCWKCFNDTVSCPFATQSTGMDYGHFPNASPAECDKGYETSNGCLAHGMKRYFGGVIAQPQSVRIKDNSTGVFGYGRSKFTSTSVVSESIYDQVVPEIYTDNEAYVDENGQYKVGMPVNCKIAAGREESDFYAALGIVGEGPLEFTIGNRTKTIKLFGHEISYTIPNTPMQLLDGQHNHGYPGISGLRYGPGTDPAGPQDWFSIGRVGSNPQNWREATNGTSIWQDNFSAGLAFLEIKRKDEKGIQLSYPSEHTMEANILNGMQGWVWTAPGTRSQKVLTNPVWIAVNMLLRARGLRFADEGTCEQYFDVNAAIAAAAVCDDIVDALIGSGEETQFKFRGVVQEEKPLRDWIQEILMNCLGYYTFAFGKLKLGVRVNSSVVEAFTEGNILFQSLQLAPLKPSFNHLTANFADREFNFAANSVCIYDIDHARLIGGNTTPQFLKANVNLSGTCSKSQAARIITTRLREELGGITPAQWKAARRLSFKTTVLALNTEPGMVCSMTHPDMPDGVINGLPAPHYGEFRVTGWKLNGDYSIDIEGQTTVNEMYDLVEGPKPADVPAGRVPTELPQWIFGLVWHPDKLHPIAGDPLYPVNEGFFDLRQQYSALADKSMQLKLVIAGKLPVNDFTPDIQPPRIGSIISDATGGTIEGDHNYFLAVCARNAEGRYSPPSNIVAVRPETGSENKIVLSDIQWPTGTFEGYDVFIGIDDSRMTCHQMSGSGLPSTIEVAVPPARSTWSLPNPLFENLRIRIKRLSHSGVARIRVDSVATNTIVSRDAIGNDDWTGRELSLIVHQEGLTTPVLNFHVSAFNQETGAFTVSPDPLAAGIGRGDVLAILAMPPGECAETSIGDAGFANDQAPDGMTAGAEIGNLVRIIAGRGRGQVRRISDNTSTVITIDSPWEIRPDATSRFIVEFPSWEHFAESNPSSNANRNLETAIAAAVSHQISCDYLVQAVSRDAVGIESPDHLSPIRITHVDLELLPNPPDQLLLAGFISGLRLIFTAAAKKWNQSISSAEMRIKLVPAGQTLDYVDLRTVAEGGSFAHNGTTQFIVNLAANWIGVSHQLFYGTNTGRYYWAVRFKNSAGWSVWSDGNNAPQFVKDYVDTDGETFSDAGPPEDWTVTIQPGPQPETAVVVASRPLINGKRILSVRFQLLNTAGVASPPAPWLDLDDNTGPAITRYDGSAIDHIWDPATATITKASGDFGDAAIHGGMIIMDVRKGQFDTKHVRWIGISASQISGNTITGIIAANPAFAPEENGTYTQIRLKIVRPPWEWNTDGYLAQAGTNTKDLWDNPTRGDLASPSFQSDPFIIPAGVNFTDLQARVWFWTDYGFSDDDIHSDCPPPEQQSGAWAVALQNQEPVQTDAGLGNFFTLTLTENRTLANVANAKHMQPLAWLIRQDATGGHTLAFGNKFKYQGSDPAGALTLNTDPNARNYIGAVYNAVDDVIDILAFDPYFTESSGGVPTTRAINTTAPLAGGGNLSADRTLSIPKATSSADGYLDKSDWVAFNSKEPALTKGSLTAASPLQIDQERQVIGGPAVISLSTAYVPRERLTANRTYYVRTDGNDSNSGLVDSAAGAFLTIQAAVNAYQSLDCNGYNVTIQVAAGTYTNPVSITFRLGAGNLYLLGDLTTPSNVVLSTTTTSITVGGHPPGSLVYIRGFKLQSSNESAMLAYCGSNVSIGNLDFGPASAGFGVYVSAGAFVRPVANYTISGSCQAHILAARGGGVMNPGSAITVTLTGTPNFGQAFAVATEASVARIYNITFSGSATGKRYEATLNGVLNVAGNGTNYLPGNSAGTTATGGQYI